VRKPIISRTIPVTCIRAKLVSTKTGETYDDDFVIARHFSDPRKLERYFRDFIETKETHVCYIISTKQTVKMYAMSENDFVQAATEITGRSAAETKILFKTK
jgi:hypothetical protein